MSTELLDLCFLVSQGLPGVRQSLAKHVSQPVSPDLCFPAPSPGKHSPCCSVAYARSGEIWMHLKHVLPSNSAGSSANREKEAHCSELWQQWASLDPFLAQGQLLTKISSNLTAKRSLLMANGCSCAASGYEEKEVTGLGP